MVAGCSRSPRFLSFFFFLFRGGTHKHTHRPVEHKSSSIRRIINSCARIGVSSRMAHETRRPSGLTRRDRTSSRSVWCPVHVREAVPSTYCSDVAFHLTHCDPVSNLARVIPLSVDAGLTLLLPRWISPLTWFAFASSLVGKNGSLIVLTCYWSKRRFSQIFSRQREWIIGNLLPNLPFDIRNAMGRW